MTGNEKEEVKRVTQFRLVMAIGDIFTMSSSYSLAHSISKDCKLSRGIARMFKSNFGRVDEIRDQKTDTGGVAILDLGQRVIYNLVTKERDPDKSIYDSISRALKAMQRDAIERNVKKIAMPRIGCGPDWLEWEHVKDILVSVFKDTDIEITVCTLRGNGQRGSKLADRTRKGEARKSESTTAKKKKAKSSEPKVRPWGMKDAATGQTDPQSQGGGEFPMHRHALEVRFCDRQLFRPLPHVFRGLRSPTWTSNFENKVTIVAFFVAYCSISQRFSRPGGYVAVS
jgi:O-acetyl-ADP-ribose deacetylase (regulator of RNase III)